MIFNAAHNPVPAVLEVQTTPPTNIQLCGEHSNEDSLLHEAGLAKPISGLDPNLQDKADAIQALAPRYACLKSALLECLLTDRPLSEIAREHSYTATALVYWIRKLGLPRRRRGRRAMVAPTRQHCYIIELVRQHGCAGAAQRAGISKQRVFQILCRWAPELKGRRPARKIVALPPRKRRSTRNIIVSFRISTDEWHRLLATELHSNTVGLSGFEKARAIVLNYLGQSGGDSGAPAQASPAPTQDAQSLDAVNVYNQVAA